MKIWRNGELYIDGEPAINIGRRIARYRARPPKSSANPLDNEIAYCVHCRHDKPLRDFKRTTYSQKYAGYKGCCISCDTIIRAAEKRFPSEKNQLQQQSTPSANGGASLC